MNILLFIISTNNYSILYTAENVVQEARNNLFCFLNTKHLHPNDLHGNSICIGVRFPNHYTHAKLEKVLPITPKDIRHFMNISYYS